MDLKDKKVTVVGLARSGVGAANLLASLGAVVTVTDKRTESELAVSAGRLAPSVRRALGGHPVEVFTAADLLVVSPGVPLEIGPIRNAMAKGIPVIGELELAYTIVNSPDDRRAGTDAVKKMEFIAITGSNGKSTTTTLVDEMLKKGGFSTILGGNIGNALTEEILGAFTSEQPAAGHDETISPFTFHFSQDFLVAEVSSFQLETIDTFRPRIASILNITPDHMDRYHSLEEYASAKARIFENQGKGDFLVINADDAETVRVVQEGLNNLDDHDDKKDRPEIYYFSRRNAVRGVYCKNDMVWCDIPHRKDYNGTVPLISPDDIRIKGVHNLENAMAASAMALLANCPVSAVVEAMKTFPGLEHRLEFVRELDGVRYMNDSKGTNVGAVEKSIESFHEPLILIAGGRDKAGDFSQLRRLVTERVKALVLIGEASDKIRKALGDLTDTTDAASLKEAVEISRRKAEKGDIVLLSPACASFDMFLDFEDRGRQFKKIVMELRGE